MEKPFGLVLDSLDDPGMAVACGTHSNPGREIQKEVIIHIVDPEALRPFDNQGIDAGVRRRHIGIVHVNQSGRFRPWKGCLDLRAFHITHLSSRQ